MSQKLTGEMKAVTQDEAVEVQIWMKILWRWLIGPIPSPEGLCTHLICI